MEEKKGGANTEVIERKTFFVGFDGIMLPEDYMENFLARGYETYYLMDDHSCGILEKMELIITLFKGSIFVVNVDSSLRGITWTDLMSGVLMRHSGDAIIIAAYAQRTNKAEEAAIARQYTYAGAAGCVALARNGGKNFLLLDQILTENNARGRRKTVRALCNTASSSATFFIRNDRVRATMQDVSLSHFSCIFDGEDPAIPLYEKCAGTQLLLNGIRFRSDTTLVMSRKLETHTLNIFTFIRQDGQAGLEDAIMPTICGKIYQMVSSPTKAMLQKVFQMMGRYRQDGRPLEALVDRVLTDVQLSDGGR